MDNLRAPELTIDQDGLWYADGVHMFRKEIIKLFATHLVRAEDGSYLIRWQGQVYPVKVADVPFFATHLTEEGNDLVVHLYDGRTVNLPEGKITMKNDIPYMSLFWPQDTRLSHQAYWELNKFLTERDGNYFIVHKNREWPVEIQT